MRLRLPPGWPERRPARQGAARAALPPDPTGLRLPRQRTARLRRLLAYPAFWTLVGLFFASEGYLAGVVLGRPIAWRAALGYALPDWYVWAVLAPAIVRLGRAVPMRPRRLAYGVVFHVAAGALAALVHAAGAVAVQTLLGLGASAAGPGHGGALLGPGAAGAGHGLGAALLGPGWPALGYGEALRTRLRVGSHLDVLTYWAILLLSYALAYWRQEQARELSASRAAAALAEARLELLRVQLDPHFLFNALNAIAGLVHTDPGAADRMIARLGELLRFSLEGRGRQEVPLREELRLLDAYAAIERARFGPRLQIVVEADPALLDAPVPSLLLQPLVENAIRHGIAPRAGSGLVHVSATRAGDHICLVVSDDGVGPRSGDAAGVRSGLGLENTRARLAQLYDEAHGFETSVGDGGGLVVRVLVPLHREAGARSPGASASTGAAP